MMVLGIVCSPRKGGNTEILVQEALAGARDSGAKTELLTVGDKEIKPCDGCLSCEKTGECHIKDDMQLVYEKMLSADGIIIGTPVYFWSMSGQAKVLIDRTYALRHPHLRLANKVAGAIAVAARTGVISTLNALQRYFASNHMFSVELVEGLAEERGTVTRDKRGMKSAYEMGRQIVSLIKQQPRFPEEFDIPLYRFVKRKYKTPRYPSN
jgi:multimeric flavodoxin WrbA